MALRRKQVDEWIALHLAGFVAEQRLGAAAERADAAIARHHHDTVGRGIENGLELVVFGLCRFKRALGVLRAFVHGRTREDQHRGGLPIPR